MKHQNYGSVTCKMNYGLVFYSVRGDIVSIMRTNIQ